MSETPFDDNSRADSTVAADELRAIIERIERLEEEKKEIGGDIKEVYSEAKGRGYDAKVIRRIVALRKQDVNERQEFEAILDLYCSALGMWVQDRLPLDDESLRVKRPMRPTREDRAAARLSESMGDTKEFSAEMMADGLISPEAHAENVALADAVDRKLGKGTRGRKPMKDADEALRDKRAEGPVFS
jgi:uncharacterized protein (UPF0335 family)